MEAGCDEVSDIDDLINLTFNLDCYDIMPGINVNPTRLLLRTRSRYLLERDLGALANTTTMNAMGVILRG